MTSLTNAYPVGADAGFDPASLVLFALLLLMVFMMITRSSRARKQLAEQRDKVQPGVRVMSTSGIFGTVVSRDDEATTSEVEIAPGTVVTFHLGALTPAPETPAGIASAQTQPARESGSHAAGVEETS